MSQQNNSKLLIHLIKKSSRSIYDDLKSDIIKNIGIILLNLPSNSSLGNELNNIINLQYPKLDQTLSNQNKSVSDINLSNYITDIINSIFILGAKIQINTTLFRNTSETRQFINSNMYSDCFFFLNQLYTSINNEIIKSLPIDQQQKINKLIENITNFSYFLQQSKSVKRSLDSVKLSISFLPLFTKEASKLIVIIRILYFSLIKTYLNKSDNNQSPELNNIIEIFDYISLIFTSSFYNYYNYLNIDTTKFNNDIDLLMQNPNMTVQAITQQMSIDKPEFYDLCNLFIKSQRLVFNKSFLDYWNNNFTSETRNVRNTVLNYFMDSNNNIYRHTQNDSIITLTNINTTNSSISFTETFIINYNSNPITIQPIWTNINDPKQILNIDVFTNQSINIKSNNTIIYTNILSPATKVYINIKEKFMFFTNFNINYYNPTLVDYKIEEIVKENDLKYYLQHIDKTIQLLDYISTNNDINVDKLIEYFNSAIKINTKMINAQIFNLETNKDNNALLNLLKNNYLNIATEYLKLISNFKTIIDNYMFIKLDKFYMINDNISNINIYNEIFSYINEDIQFIKKYIDEANKFINTYNINPGSFTSKDIIGNIFNGIKMFDTLNEILKIGLKKDNFNKYKDIDNEILKIVSFIKNNLTKLSNNYNFANNTEIITIINEYKLNQQNQQNQLNQEIKSNIDEIIPLLNNSDFIELYNLIPSGPTQSGPTQSGPTTQSITDQYNRWKQFINDFNNIYMNANSTIHKKIDDLFNMYLKEIKLSDESILNINKQFDKLGKFGSTQLFNQELIFPTNNNNSFNLVEKLITYFIKIKFIIFYSSSKFSSDLNIKKYANGFLKFIFDNLDTFVYSTNRYTDTQIIIYNIDYTSLNNIDNTSLNNSISKITDILDYTGKLNVSLKDLIFYGSYGINQYSSDKKIKDISLFLLGFFIIIISVFYVNNNSQSNNSQSTVIINSKNNISDTFKKLLLDNKANINLNISYFDILSIKSDVKTLSINGSYKSLKTNYSNSDNTNNIKSILESTTKEIISIDINTDTIQYNLLEQIYDELINTAYKYNKSSLMPNGYIDKTKYTYNYENEKKTKYINYILMNKTINSNSVDLNKDSYYLILCSYDYN